MSKFWSVILKIIIVISILGIIFFVGFAIFKNQNISFEAYNYITRCQDETDFQTLHDNIINNVILFSEFCQCLSGVLPHLQTDY